MLSRRSILGGILFALLAVFAFAPQAKAQSSSTWTIKGVVIDSGNQQPVSGAIVYLKNTQTESILTYITGKDGSFVFSYAPANVDYSIWAVLNGKKGDERSISSFNTRPTVYINLHVKS